MDDKSIKKNLREMRMSAGLSQSEMARRMGITRNTYVNLELGDTRVVNENIFAAAAAMNESTEKLITGYDWSETDGEYLSDVVNKYEKEIVSLRNENNALALTLQAKEAEILELKNDLKAYKDIIFLLKKQKEKDLQ